MITDDLEVEDMHANEEDGALDDSDIALALSIVTDSNATPRAIRDAALALDGVLQTSHSIPISQVEALFFQVHTIIAQLDDEAATVIVLLRLCSTLLLLDLVNSTDAVGCGIVATIAGLLQRHHSDIDMQMACLQVASILCYVPGFFSLAEETELSMEILEVLRRVTSKEAELQGLAVLEVMLESNKVRRSPEIAEIVIECVRSSYGVELCRSGACILATLSAIPEQLQAIMTHADLDFFSACIQALQAHVDALTDVLAILKRAVNDEPCMAVLAQDIVDNRAAVDRLRTSVQTLDERFSQETDATSAEIQHVLSLCQTVVSGIKKLEPAHEIFPEPVDEVLDFAQQYRFMEQDSSEREHSEMLQTRQETVTRRHQLADGILLQLQSNPNIADETLPKVQLLVEIAKSTHSELEQSLKRLDDWHALQTRTMQQLQVLDDENKDLRLRLTESAMTVDQLSQDLYSCRQQLEQRAAQEMDLNQALDAVKTANAEAEEWQRRYFELQDNPSLSNGTQSALLERSNGSRSMRRITSNASLPSATSISHQSYDQTLQAEAVEIVQHVLQELHLQLVKNQHHSERALSPQPQSQRKMQEAPAADDARVVEIAILAHQVFSSLLSGTSSIDQPTAASMARVRRCLRTLGPVDGRHVVAGDVDIILSNCAVQSQLKSKSVVNFEAFLRALLQLLTRRYDLQDCGGLMGKAILHLRSASEVTTAKSNDQTQRTSRAEPTQNTSWIDQMFDSTDVRDLEGVKALLDQNSRILEQIFAAYTTSTPRSHSRLHTKTMDFQRLLIVAKDFELVPTIVDKKQFAELYERICAQSQVAPQIGVSATGFMELLGVMGLTSNWLRDVAGLQSATDRMVGLFKHMDATNAKHKLAARHNSTISNFYVR